MSNNKDFNKNAWTKYTEKQVEEIFDFCNGYKDFMSKCKTERECATEIISLAKQQGYEDLEDIIKNNKKLSAGDKVYVNNKGKAVALFIVGSEPMESGLKILGAHIDSPRLDLKQNPLYEDSELSLLDTHYYGGIKKYQWVTLPLALHGVVVKKDGTIVDICVGEDENDPVVGVSDLLVHLSGEQLGKKADKVVEGEDLNVLVGSMPLKGTEKEAVKANILKILKENMILKKMTSYQLKLKLFQQVKQEIMD